MNLTPPTIAGTAQEGETLTGDEGTWTGATSFTDQWVRCESDGSSCVAISGATGTTRTLTAADVGKRLKFEVTASNDGGSTVATSDATAVVAPAPDETPTGPPTSFTATLGATNVTLSWTNPTDADFDHVLIRRGTSAPSGPTDGTSVCDPCSSPETATRPAEGVTYHYAAFAVDDAGNVSSAARDSVTGPDETATGPPTSFTATLGATNVTLSWTNPTDADFDHVLIRRGTSAPSGPTDGTSICNPCSSPETTARPAEGVTYHYAAFAVDDAGNVSSAAAEQATNPNVAPTVSITSPASGTAVSGGVSVVWNANEDGDFTVLVAADSCTTGTELDNGDYTGGSVTTPIGALELVSGSNTVRVCVTDAAGNTGSTSITIIQDSQPPDTTISESPSNPINETTATFEFSASEPESEFTCKLDDGEPATCSSPHVFADLGEGSHTFSVAATDLAGNVDETPATHPWEIDLTPGSRMRNVSAKPGDAIVVVRYAFPPDTAIKRVVITRTRPGTDFSVVRKRSWAWRFRDRTARNGRLHTYELRSRDAAGNLSEPVTVSARPRDPLISPPDGARIGARSTPLFRWVGVAGAVRYNMQLWLRTPDGRRKVLSVFPAQSQYQLGKRWRYRGNTHRLKRGRVYDWYVWPWYGTSYGKVLGWNWFRVRL